MWVLSASCHARRNSRPFTRTGFLFVHLLSSHDMFYLRLTSLILTLSLFGSGCFAVELRPTSVEHPNGIPTTEQQVGAWKNVSDRLDRWVEMISPSSTARLTM